MQGPRPQPVGVIFNTSMSRPDSALALGALYVFQNRREARIGAVSVAGSGLNTAIFCDIIGRFYSFGPPPEANTALPVGLADVRPLPADSAMVNAVVDRKNEKGEPLYPRTIRKVTDTAMAEAVIRNGVTYNAESVIVLSAPATYLAKSLDLLGVKDLYKERVKRLVIVDSADTEQDAAALGKVLAEFPSPIFLCSKEVGDTLPYPASSIEKDFGWAPAHPIVDAYRAYKPMSYDAPSYDLAAVHYAVHPDSGFFQVSAPKAGKPSSVMVDRSKKEELVQSLIETASAKPLRPAPRGKPA